jgi:hypothetical protein
MGSHLLLDNPSTADIFCNLNFFDKIRTVRETLAACTPMVV